MKLLYKYIFGFSMILHVQSQFLSLLREFDMRNPIIIGTKENLKPKEMFQLMKNIMKQNQSIILSTNFTANLNGITKSPGIIFNKYLSIDLYKMNFRMRKPWIIIGERSKEYSQINEPLYVLDNGIIWEQYKFKSIQKINALAALDGKELKWNKNVSKNFFERRGNLENLTLIGMTDVWDSKIILPNNLEQIAKVSTAIPNTYEVSTLTLCC